MAFNKIQEYISTDDGNPGTLLIPKLIMPELIAERDKALIPREMARNVWGPSQIQGSSFTVNLDEIDTMSVREVGEGAEVPLDKQGYETATFTPVKYGVAVRITKEMIEDSQFELFQRNIRLAGKRFAENETKLVLTALDGANTTITGGAQIVIANITEAMENIENADFVPSDMLVGNSVVNDLRNIDTFVEADKSGSREMLDKGFVGSIYGMNVARFSNSTKVAPSTSHKLYAYVLDRSEAYGIAIKRDITVDNFELATYDMSGAVITQRIDVQLLRSTAVSKITTT